eukprot:scaffold21032_cov78-Skeletonema_dohrnii-CCMP3373.AAC.2
MRLVAQSTVEVDAMTHVMPLQYSELGPGDEVKMGMLVLDRRRGASNQKDMKSYDVGNYSGFLLNDTQKTAK